MPRLFYKLFIIIWLTLATIFAVVILFVNFSHTAPFDQELAHQKRELVLNLIAKALVENGLETAEAFVHTNDALMPPGLIISTVSDTNACMQEKTTATRSVLREGVCYRISVSDQAGFIPDNLAVLMPWLAILVSSAIAAGGLARYSIRPLVHLRDGLSALAHGRFDFRIGNKMTRRKDEVTALVHDFDSSAARLQELQDAQQRLFHDVSHELCSPLFRLQAAIGALRQRPAKLVPMLDRMDREVERLDMLVGEILTLARLTAGASLPLKTQSLDVIELLNEILSDAAFEARAREVSITAYVGGVFLAEVEGELLHQALENVIRNGVKYTAPHSSISVSCEMTANLLKIRVTHTELGVGRDEIERIFQPFSRGTEARLEGGYGLGLAITRQAIERHGGRVYASLSSEGCLAITLEILKFLES